MKFTISKNCLVDALSRMSDVATRGIKTDFNLAHRVTIKAQANDVQFYSTNGHLNAKWEVTSTTDKNYSCDTQGMTTIDVMIAKAVAQSISGSKSDILVCCYLEGDCLYMKDNNSKAKKQVKMQTLGQHIIGGEYNFSITKPKKGFSTTMRCEDFRRNMYVISKYVSKRGYKIRYQMVCMHFLKDETRLVGGDGMRFAILQNTLAEPNSQVKSDDGEKFLFPCDQALIVSNLLDGADNVDIIFEDAQTCYIKPHNAMEMKLHGIPNDKYIPYEKHAFRTEEAKVIIDIKQSDFMEVVGVVSAIRDKEMEDAEGFQSCRFSLDGSNLEFIVDENKYQCDYTMEVDAYPIGDTKQFKSCYAAMYLGEAAKAMPSKSYVRFYCLDEKKTIIVEPIDIDDTNKDSNGVPRSKSVPGDPRLSIFFAAVSEESAES